MLIAARAFQGIGGGIITANAFTIIGDLFAARERGKLARAIRCSLWYCIGHRAATRWIFDRRPITIWTND